MASLWHRNWMHKIIRHARFLRWFFPFHYQRERDIACQIRAQIIGSILNMKDGQRLKELEKIREIKGYGQTLY